MARKSYGSLKFQDFGRGSRLESLPERKVVSYRDFRRGYTPSEQRQMINEAASAVTHDMEIRNDNRIWRAPGTEHMESFPTHSPSRMALHPNISGAVQLALYAPPFIGFRGYEHAVEWTDLGMQNRQFASTTFGGTFIFTDGNRVWARPRINAPIVELDEAVPAVSYASMAGRVYAGGTLIDGRWEPLGIRWTAANSDYRDWTTFGSGFELLLNDLATGDSIQSLVPMSLDFMAVFLRNSVWVGRFTGQPLRPVDFGSSARATGTGAINPRVTALTRFGVIFLSDFGVYIFDGNTCELLSKDINGELLPLDYTRLDEYHATYDPIKKRYILFSPRGRNWVFDVEHTRWTKRTYTCRDSTIFPQQVDPIRWFEILGDWNSKGEVRWLDLAGEKPGNVDLVFLGDQADTAGTFWRVLARESRSSYSYFGRSYKPYWETKLFDEQDASHLITSVKQLVEYEGKGCLRLYLPDEDNIFERVLEASLANRDYPSTAIFNAQKVGKGTGIGIEFCPGEPEEIPVAGGGGGTGEEPTIDDPSPPEPTPTPTGEEFSGFTVFSDVHQCTPEEDSQQFAQLEVACFTWCDEAVCGGTGGFLVWYSNDPEELSQGCDHPNNPIPALRAGSS